MKFFKLGTYNKRIVGLFLWNMLLYLYFLHLLRVISIKLFRLTLNEYIVAFQNSSSIKWLG